MRLEVRSTVAIPRDRIFAAVADVAEWPALVPGISRWEHAGGPTTGLGARYSMRMRVGAADVGGLIEVVEWDTGREIAWASVLGLEQRGRWRLRDHGETATDVVLRFSYSSPGTFLSRIADWVASRTVQRNLEGALASLRRLELSDVSAAASAARQRRPRSGTSRRPARSAPRASTAARRSARRR